MVFLLLQQLDVPEFVHLLKSICFHLDLFLCLLITVQVLLRGCGLEVCAYLIQNESKVIELLVHAIELLQRGLWLLLKFECLVSLLSDLSFEVCEEGVLN